MTGGDDALVLRGPAFARTPVALDPACPEPLQRSLRAHSGLQVVALDQAAELRVLCSPGYTAAPGPTLRFHGAAPVPVAAAPRWRPGAGRLEELHLLPGWIAANAWDATPVDGEPLLLADDGQPLIVVRAGPPVAITSTLDMSHGEFVRQPEYAVLVAALVDLALGRRLLDPLIASSRDPEASLIAPSRLQAAQLLGPRFGAARQPLGEIFLALAALVLLADLVIIWRAGRAARHG